MTVDHAAARGHYEGLAAELAAERLLRDLLAEAKDMLPVDCYDLRGRIHDALYVPVQGEPILGTLADPADLVFENYAGDSFGWFRR